MVTDKADFTYDIAFSLLDRDLTIAESIMASLEPRISAFLYSERQLELAAKDGVDEFTAVFRRRARVVAILLREDWGTTKWTRIEQTAIKNRGFDEGYEFLVVIPLDGPSCVPDWVPRTYIWADYTRLGARGAAAIIERKILERGHAITAESPEDTERRLARRREAEQQRDQFLRSSDGVRAADSEVERLNEYVQHRRESLQLRITRHQRDTTVTKGDYSLTIHWWRTYGSTLAESGLRIRLWDGMMSDHIDHDLRAKHTTAELQLAFHCVDGDLGWRSAGPKSRFYPTAELAEHVLNALVKVSYGEPASL